MTIETKEAARIGYNGGFFPAWVGEARDAEKETRYFQYR